MTFLYPQSLVIFIVVAWQGVQNLANALFWRVTRMALYPLIVKENVHSVPPNIPETTLKL